MAGQPRNFKDVDALQKAWDEFKIDLKVQANEWIKTQYVGKDGSEVNQAMKVPMTFEGFKRFCRSKYGCVEQYFSNQDEVYNEYINICRAIKDEIREQQIIGGLLGFYNPSITQRLNGLTDKTQTTFNVSPKILNIDPIGGDENE
jgi:hypothetical protein